MAYSDIKVVAVATMYTQDLYLCFDWASRAEPPAPWRPSGAGGAGSSHWNGANVSAELISAGREQLRADGRAVSAGMFSQVTSDPGGVKESAGMCCRGNSLHYTDYK